MSELIKGNFQTQRKVDVQNKELTLEERFEMEALKKLGGSMAFVSKRKIIWDMKE